MNIPQRIKYDIGELNSYFKKLFNIMEESEQFSEFSHYKAYAKSDMVCNIYGCLEFWVKIICESKHSTLNLQLTYLDIKAKNDLAGYHKYLQKVAGIDLSTTIESYNALQNLRAVRNCIIHAGSHTNNEEINKIQGISLSGSLIVVSNEYVFNSLNNTEVYLLGVNNA